MPCMFRCFVIKLNKRGKVLRTPADDRENQRQAEQAGANDGFLVSAASDPYRQRLLRKPNADKNSTAAINT